MDDTERRYALNARLKEIAGDDVSVYFQPPESVSLTYPCIIYSRSDNEAMKANNGVYGSRRQYSVMVITEDPDDNLIDKIRDGLSYCRITRHYTVDNLYHGVAQVYY